MTYNQKFKKVVKVFPIIKKLVDWGKVEALCALSSEPFSGDDEYFDLVRILFVVQARLNNIKRDYWEYYFQPGADSEKRSGKIAKNFQMDRIMEGCTLLVEVLWEVFSKRSSATRKAKKKPRILRLQKNLELSEFDVQVLLYLVLYSLEPEFNKIHFKDDLQGMAIFFRFNHKQLLEVIAPNNKLVKNKILNVEVKSFDNNILSTDISLEREFIKALRGLPLTAEELLKIEGTPIADLLKEEGGAKRKGESKESLYLEKEKSPEPGGMIQEEERMGKPSHLEEDSFTEDDDEDFDEDVSREEDFRLLGSKEKKEFNDQTLLESLIAEDEEKLLPYTNDLEYYEDYFEWLDVKNQLKEMLYEKTSHREDDRKTQIRQLRAKDQVLLRKCQYRMELTRKAGDWLPRLERLCRDRGYGEFEKNILLLMVGAHISPRIMEGIRTKCGTLKIINMFNDDLQSQIEARKYFYKSSRLVRDGIIHLDSWTRDFASVDVEIDRKMLDYLVGLDTEISELVEGSHIYTPAVEMDHVILPEQQKDLILRTARSFYLYKKVKEEKGFKEMVSYGNSLVMLFYGPSGTGKTMMANALAKLLGKKLLLINFPNLGSHFSDEVIRFIFREARINDAVIFFDECEGIFESRDASNPGLHPLLTEFERYDGLIIMATNRPQVLDEAMYRRITLAVPFPKPDHKMRCEIWKVHIFKGVDVSAKVDFHYLAYKYELTGGLIKNAVQTAVGLAVERDTKNIVIQPEDFENGARSQLKGHLKMGDFQKKVIPKAGLEAVILPEKQMAQLQAIVNFEKSKKVLFGQWGFDDATAQFSQGSTILFHGPSGTGKTFAAEAIGFDLGRPIMRMNMSQIISKWVGETAKHIETIFAEAKNSEAILLIDEADALFAPRTGVYSSTDRYANMDVDVLLQELERYEGIIILTTNFLENIEPALFRRLHHVCNFPKPDEDLRERLWREMIPDRTPVNPDIDFARLGKKFEFTGGQIKNVIFRAASLAALRESPQQMISQEDLEAAAREELGVAQERKVGFT